MGHDVSVLIPHIIFYLFVEVWCLGRLKTIPRVGGSGSSFGLTVGREVRY